MKRLLLFSACLLVLSTVMPTIGATAQSNIKAFTSTTNSNGRDTVTNTATKIQSLTLDGFWDITTIDVDVTKVSGTVAGNLILRGSINAAGFKDVDTVAVANVAGVKGYTFSVNPSIYRYYQVEWTGTGTMVGSFVTNALVRNRPK